VEADQKERVMEKEQLKPGKAWEFVCRLKGC